MFGVYQILASVVVSLAIGFGGGWTTNGWRLGAEIAQIKQDQSDAVTKGVQQALADTIKYQRTKDDAIKKAESRAAAAAVSAAANRAQSDGLRAQLESAKSGIPGATHDSIRAYAATLNTVFGECQREYEALGRHATSHASDSLTLQMSWPKDEK